MATALKIRAEHEPSYYDRATEEDCKAEKVVDITEDCLSIEEGGRAILVYTRDSRRRLVEVRLVDKDAENDAGSLTVLVPVDEPDFYIKQPTGLDHLIPYLGLTKLQLSEIITKHAPD